MLRVLLAIVLVCNIETVLGHGYEAKTVHVNKNNHRQFTQSGFQIGWPSHSLSLSLSPLQPLPLCWKLASVVHSLFLDLDMVAIAMYITILCL
jgi:hypothetical protein